MLRVLCVSLLLFSWQCNDTANDPQSPTDDPSPPDGDNVCPRLALTAFEQHIQPAIDASCHICHGKDGEHINKIKLLKKESDDTITINRATMLSHRNKWLIKDGMLLDKISDNTHGGGNQVALGHITEGDITAWVQAEQRCSKK